MYSMHGGAGALMSIGLMRKVSWDFVEPCVLKTFSTGIATHVVYRLLFEHAPMSLSSDKGTKIFVHMDSPISLLYTHKLVLFHQHSALFSLHSAQSCLRNCTAIQIDFVPQQFLRHPSGTGWVVF